MNKRKSRRMVEVHKFRGGKLSIYKQSTTNSWYARFFTEGKYKVCSAGEANFNIAKKVSMDRPC